MVTLSSKIREQLISSFGVELAEHVQTMTNGLLALEQDQLSAPQRQTTLEDIFRAAHSLKGAARALGVSAVEQLAHALENVLDLMQQGELTFTSELFTVCYRALDTIQLVQAIYDSGGTTPPVQVLQTMAELDTLRTSGGMPPAAGTSPVEDAPQQHVVALPTRNDKPVSIETHADAPTPALAREQIQPESAHIEPAPAESKPTDDLPTPVTHTVVEPPQQPAEDEHPASSPDDTVRVSVNKLDALMVQISELLVTKIRAEQRLTQVNRVRDVMSEWQKDWLKTRRTYGRLLRKLPRLSGQMPLHQDIAHLLEYVNANQAQMRHIHTLVNSLSRDYAHDTLQASLVIDSLEQEVKQVRMLPLNSITGTFGRMVRDLAKAAQKEAVIHIVGSEVELDKRVLEQIKDPLIHLLRNAIDHGLETPEERTQLGKPPVGRITLTAEQAGKDVVLRVEDDGRGLDIAAIRQVAQRKDHLAARVAEMSESELVELIFAPRFSTSPIITDVSGRGVGLDVVRRNVGALSGRIDVDWKPGRGTTFTLTLPAALTSTRGLLVRVSGQRFAIPFGAIECILRVSPEEMTRLGGRETLHHQGRPYPLVSLANILDLPPREPVKDGTEQHHIVIVVATAERRMAFVVDDLDGEQEMVVKGLGQQLRRVGGIAGSTVLGNGDVILVLNVADLIHLTLRAGQRTNRAKQAPAFGYGEPLPPRRILVVDDSVTTRILEKNVLEAAGYEVQLAVNGQEALSIITAGDLPDLIISDVVMPRLDGFGLAEQIKSDARTANIPVILVTSLDSAEDKTRGIEVGADAYIVKSQFDQNNLLETIEQLI